MCAESPASEVSEFCTAVTGQTCALQPLDAADQDLRNRIGPAVTRLRADLGLTMPSGAGQRFLPSLAGPSRAGPYRDEPAR